MPQVDPAGVVAGTRSVQVAAKAEVTLENGKHCYILQTILSVKQKFMLQ